MTVSRQHRASSWGAADELSTLTPHEVLERASLILTTDECRPDSITVRGTLAIRRSVQRWGRGRMRCAFAARPKPTPHVWEVRAPSFCLLAAHTHNTHQAPSYTAVETRTSITRCRKGRSVCLHVRDNARHGRPSVRPERNKSARDEYTAKYINSARHGLKVLACVNQRSPLPVRPCSRFSCGLVAITERLPARVSALQKSGASIPRDESLSQRNRRQHFGETQHSRKNKHTERHNICTPPTSRTSKGNYNNNDEGPR